ncbi:MAG: amidase [Pseudolabrys sp.]
MTLHPTSAPPPAAATRAPDIVMLDAVALGRAIRERQVSCRDVMAAYLDHIERINPHVNAIVALQERQGLLASADERDAQLRRGEPVGPLHGFPLAVKDLSPVKGLPLTMGSPIFKDFIATADSVMVERLRKAGAIFIGKTNTPEFGFGSHTYNQVYGVTRNAYDQALSAGGSSGGAAVAVALRLSPLADGSDYGGSLRNPAAWNNVFGFRTSIGRVPADGRDAWLPSMSVLGPMARNVVDLAMLLDVQAGYDARVPLSIGGDATNFQGALEADLKGKRIAWVGDFNGHIFYDPDLLALCKAALGTFEQLGCAVEEALPDYPIDAVLQAWQVLRSWQMGGTLLPHYNDPKKRALLKPEIIFDIERAMTFSAFDVTAAARVRTEWYHAVRVFFEKYDFIVAPTAQIFPFDAEIPWPTEVAGHRMQTYNEWMIGMGPVTMLGGPALAVPAGFNDRGLTAGIQIVGPNRADLSCLQLAHGYDAATQWASRRRPALLDRP